MAEICFADYSALGAGTSFNYDNELTEAPEEEEEFDVLNDETFGGDDFGEEFDWEEQNEKFAEALGSGFQGRPNDSGFHTAEKSFKTQEEYMEESINQLVIDDDDVESDPAVVNLRKGHMIPRKQQSLDALFGPSSPPSLLDTEYLVSPTGRNIWGSPVAEKPVRQKQQVSNIQSLFDFAKSANVSQESQSMQSHHKTAPVVLPKAQTLQEIESSILSIPKVLTAEELERHLRGESLPSSLPNGRRSPASQYPIPPHGIASSPHTRQPMSYPGMVGMMNGHGSPGTLAGPMIKGMSMVGTPPYRNQHPSQPSLNRQSPVMSHGWISPVSRSPTPPLLRTSPIPQTPVIRVPARFMSPYTSPSLSRFIASPGRGYSQPIGIPHPSRVQATPGSPYNSPQAQALYGSPQGPMFQSPQQHRFNQPVHDNQFNRHANMIHNNNNNNINHKYQSPMGRSPHRNGDRIIQTERDKPRETCNNREHSIASHPNSVKEMIEIICKVKWYYRYPYNQKHGEKSQRPVFEKRGSNDEDEFVGLMTQKEKDWIIKIQLMQLQTDNPYIDDFYYTTWCMKKKAKEREKDGQDDSDPKLVIPAMAKIENKAYKPAQFEGSLGRLTTSSVHNPRQIIDLLAKSVSESAGSNKLKSTVGKELRKSRQLLMDIEKGYNFLLAIEDIEKKILALPEDMGKLLFEERSYKIDLLFHYLLCDGNSAAFMQYMKVRKGRGLTTRALPLLDKVQSVGIVSLICKNLQQLMKKDKPEERLEDMFYPCAKVIESCNLATIVMFVEDIQQEESQSTNKPIAIALQHKFGSSVLCTLLHRGEQIYETTSPVDLESNLQNEWSDFVQEFSKILATIPIESVMPPLQVHADIENHLERLLNKRMMAVVEDNLRIFTHSDPQPTS